MCSERSDRDMIKEDIRKRLVKIKGIGPEKAERGSDAVMEYLDGLVSSQQENPCKYIVNRPGGVPQEFNYVMFKPNKMGTSISHYWVTVSRPTEAPGDPLEVPIIPEERQGLFAFAVTNHMDLQKELISILADDPQAFYARFSDV